MASQTKTRKLEGKWILEGKRKANEEFRKRPGWDSLWARQRSATGPCRPANKARTATLGPWRPTKLPFRRCNLRPAKCHGEEVQREAQAPFNQVRSCLQWWQKHAPKSVINLILQGVEPHFLFPHLEWSIVPKTLEEHSQALSVMEEYVRVRAA